MKLLLAIFSIVSVNSFAQLTYVPDDNFEAYLELNSMGNGIPNDDSVVTNYINIVTDLNVSGQGIYDLTGIEEFTSLVNLDCSQNQLAALNVTQNLALKNLRCYNNQIEVLDVSQNTSLSLLSCFYNKLSVLDVSQNPSLNFLRCYFNQLYCLKANNGMNISTLECQSQGSNLECVSVFDPVWSASNAVYDSWITFDTQCIPQLDLTISQLGGLLVSNQNNATYQWLDCDNNYTPIIGATDQSYLTAVGGNFAVEITMSCETTVVDTSLCQLVDFTGINELSSPDKELVKIVDLMGREIPNQSNTILIYMYSDGTTKKVFTVE